MKDFLNDSLDSYCWEHFLVGVFSNVSARAGTDKRFSVDELCVSLHSGYILQNFSLVGKGKTYHQSFTRGFNVWKAHTCLLVFVGFLARACHLFYSFEIPQVFCTPSIWWFGWTCLFNSSTHFFILLQIHATWNTVYLFLLCFPVSISIFHSTSFWSVGNNDF